MVRENQRLGALVEQLVRESLEDEGFDVQTYWRRIGLQAIQAECGCRKTSKIRLELTRDGRTWLVEIKSARNDSVRMTSVQAREVRRAGIALPALRGADQEWTRGSGQRNRSPTHALRGRNRRAPRRHLR